MKKLDLSNVQEFKDFKRPVGGFVVKIKGVEDVTDKEYLKVYYDIVDCYNAEDKPLFVGMYAKRKKERGYQYPFTIISYKETALSMFKGFCTAISESNDGYDFTESYDEATLVGKKFGVVLGEEEYEGTDKNGLPKVKIRTNVVQRKSVATIMGGDFKIPELKKLEQSNSPVEENPFAQAKKQTVVDETVPFNTPAEVDDDEFDDVPF